MNYDGRCHCGNLSFSLDWPDDDPVIARACGCDFCVKHGGVWTSNRDAALAAVVDDHGRITKYRFGTSTADFYVCAVCGGVPFVVSEIDGKSYAVVNVNTFEGVDPSAFARTPTDFEGERAGSRLERRQRNWIPSVSVR
ncbi:MAG: hypothetical protein AAF493_25630 [Pseudomonadota bacterium]